MSILVRRWWRYCWSLTFCGLSEQSLYATIIIMFTGIIEEVGTVISFEDRVHAWRLIVEAHRITREMQLGDSVAVNGCCLTAVAFTDDRIEFDSFARVCD